jgi:N-acetylmuramoyl-L-alanine amidase
MALHSLLPAARLKRRLIDELVAENVALIEGVQPARRRRPRPLRDLTRLVLVILLAGGALRSSHLLAGRDGEPASSGDAGGAASLAAGMDATAAETTSPAPAIEDRRAGGSPGEGVLLAGLPRAAAIDPRVFPLAVRRVAIDAGHGGSSMGAMAPDLPAEKELTLDIAERLERLLAASEFETIMTRDSDHDVPLRQRARLANEAGADLFLSIHLNWLEDRGARGIETYYAGLNEDPTVNRLAMVENGEHGHSFSDLESLLERLLTDVRQEESRALAEVVQRALWTALQATNPLLQNRGVKAAPFTVLISTDMPSVLAEVSCLSHQDEARLLQTP